MKILYVAEDGAQFADRLNCEAYESKMTLFTYVRDNIEYTSNEDFGGDVISVDDVVSFIRDHKEDIFRILSNEF